VRLINLRDEDAIASVAKVEFVETEGDEDENFEIDTEEEENEVEEV